MKSVKLFLAVLAVVSVAHADFVAGRVRTVQNAKTLSLLNEQGEVVNNDAGSLTAQKMDGAAGLYSFTLTTKHIVFCKMAPCPPIKISRVFRVISTRQLTSKITEYVANEVAPGIASGSFVGRQIEVIEDSFTHTVSVAESDRRAPNAILANYEGKYVDLMITM